MKIGIVGSCILVALFLCAVVLISVGMALYPLGTIQILLLGLLGVLFAYVARVLLFD